MRLGQMRRLLFLAFGSAALLASVKTASAQGQIARRNKRALQGAKRRPSATGQVCANRLCDSGSDDGAIAEGYRESVARILVDRWKTPQELASLTKNDKPVLSFVL